MVAMGLVGAAWKVRRVLIVIRSEPSVLRCVSPVDQLTLEAYLLYQTAVVASGGGVCVDCTVDQGAGLVPSMWTILVSFDVDNCGVDQISDSN